MQCTEPCKLWEGYIDKATGYGRTASNEWAHRWAYRQAYGPIPEGLHIDHLCSVRACIEPTHLEAVTQAENNRRMHAKKTHCVHGHFYTEETTYIRPDGRGKGCRVCRTESVRRSRANALH